MNVSDERINLWAQAISDTEEDKCRNAITQITTAVRQRFGKAVTILPKGSHENRTNIRADSDVDIAVIHNDYFFENIGRLSESDKLVYKSRSILADYRFETFKSDMHGLLTDTFGASSVERQNKCIRVSGNSTRISADVVPAYEYQRFSTPDAVEAVGIALLPDRGGGKMTSFPAQHYSNGVAKNDATSRSFKAAVRVLKNARTQMIEKGLYPRDAMPSFFIECLVWNVGNRHFANATYREDARAIAGQIWSDMRDPVQADSYAEISDLQWLFRGQTRTPAQAEDFALKVWSYLEP